MNQPLHCMNAMSDHAFENTYDLSDKQLQELDEAEELMLKGSLGAAESMLLSMLKLSLIHI